MRLIRINQETLAEVRIHINALEIDDSTKRYLLELIDALSKNEQAISSLYESNVDLFLSKNEYKERPDSDGDELLDSLYDLESAQESCVLMLARQLQILADQGMGVAVWQDQLKEEVIKQFSPQHDQWQQIQSKTYVGRLQRLEVDFREAGQWAIFSCIVEDAWKEAREEKLKFFSSLWGEGITLLDHVKYMMALSDWQIAIGVEGDLRQNRLYKLEGYIQQCLHELANEWQEHFRTVHHYIDSIGSLRRQVKNLQDLAEFLEQELSSDQLDRIGFSRDVLKKLTDMKRYSENESEGLSDDDKERFSHVHVSTHANSDAPVHPPLAEEIILKIYTEFLFTRGRKLAGTVFWHRNYVSFLGVVSIEDLRKIFSKLQAGPSPVVREKQISAGVSLLGAISEKVHKGNLYKMCCEVFPDIAWAVGAGFINPNDVPVILGCDNPRQDLFARVESVVIKSSDVGAHIDNEKKELLRGCPDLLKRLEDEVAQINHDAKAKADRLKLEAETEAKRNNLVARFEAKIIALAKDLDGVSFFNRDKRQAKLDALLNIHVLMRGESANEESHFQTDVAADVQGQIDAAKGRLQRAGVFKNSANAVIAHYKEDVLFAHIRGKEYSEVYGLIHGANGVYENFSEIVCEAAERESSLTGRASPSHFPAAAAHGEPGYEADTKNGPRLQTAPKSTN